MLKQITSHYRHIMFYMILKSITELRVFACSIAENRGHILLCWYCCPLVHKPLLWCYS